jgi:ADP-heptose:LPS heptosyltransferase
VSTVEPFVSILIVRTSSIGDVTLATVLVDFLRSLNPSIAVGWISRGSCCSFLEQALPGVRTFDFDHGETAIVSYMSAAKVNLIVDLQGTLRSRIYSSHLASQFKAKCIHIKKDSFRRSQKVLQSRFVTKRQLTSPSATEKVKPQYKIMLDCLKKGLRSFYDDGYTDILNIEARPKLGSIPSHITNNEPILFVAPGASFATKQAPQSVFKAILERYQVLCQNSEVLPAPIIFLGDKKDRTTSSEIVSELTWSNTVQDLCGEIDLYSCSRELQKGRILLCNDSGLAHIAEAVGIDTAVLFGPTHEDFGFFPHRPTSKAFSVPLNCRPCSKHGRSACRFSDLQCFHLISIELVAQHIFERIHK